ncbi:MAG: hypothetical protein WDZ93_03550 [Candidatus Paceibacterota bacterium]
MTPKHYAQALMDQLNAGMRPANALAGLNAALARRGHGKLKRRILAILYRQLLARLRDTNVTLTLGTDGDEKRHKTAIKAVCAALDVPVPTETVIDDTLIGGFMVTTKDKRSDNSYKRTLYNLYRNIINSSRI